MNRRLPGCIGVGGDIADSQMVVAEDLRAARLLGQVMLADGAPANHRLFVAPGRMRQNPTRTPLALEALVVHEAVDLFQDRLQALGQGEIVVEPRFFRVDLEDHREHWDILVATGSHRSRLNNILAVRWFGSRRSMISDRHLLFRAWPGSHRRWHGAVTTAGATAPA